MMQPPLDTAPEKMGTTRGEREKASAINLESLTPSSRPFLGGVSRGARWEKIDSLLRQRVRAHSPSAR